MIFVTFTFTRNQKMGEWSPMLTNIFNAYKRVQSCLHSEIYRTFENKQNITCKLSVCRLPISFVQATWSFVEATSFVKQLYYSFIFELANLLEMQNMYVLFTWNGEIFRQCYNLMMKYSLTIYFELSTNSILVCKIPKIKPLVICWRQKNRWKGNDQEPFQPNVSSGPKHQTG